MNNRFKEIREHYEITHKCTLTMKQLADEFAKKNKYTTLQYPAIRKLEIGERKATVEELKQYCDFFKTTADYLLGIRDSKPVDENLAMVCNYTGLSDDSIEYIRNASEYEQKLLDALLRNGYFNEIAAAIHSYMETRFKTLELQDNFTGNKNLESEKMDIAEYRATKRFSETLVKKIAENKEIQNYSRWDHALEGLHNNPLKPDPAYIRKITEAIRSGKKTFNDICEEEGSDC